MNETFEKDLISISIVSHGQRALVHTALKSLAEVHHQKDLEILLTENLPDVEPLNGRDFPFPLRIHRNRRPMGFSANHNRAFRRAAGEFFCILNPDVRFTMDVFPGLLEDLRSKRAEIVSPLILDQQGQIQDSFRSVPTIPELLRRIIGRQPYSIANLKGQEFIYSHWLAGIFLLMPAKIYRDLGGLDEKFRLYFEDVDFGCRAWLAGYRLMVDTRCSIRHDARRLSRRSLFHGLNHLLSALRFYTSGTYRRFKSQDIQRLP
jgi:hypothetical protein